MNLSDREKRLLLACFDVSAGGDFNWREAGAKAGFAEDEADDLAQMLNGKGVFDAFTFGHTAILSADGRELARGLIEERERARVPIPTSEESEIGRIVREAEERQRHERLLLACYDASLATDGPDFSLNNAAKWAGFDNKDAASNYLLTLHKGGLIRIMSRGSGAMTDEGKAEVKRLRGRRKAASQPEQGDDVPCDLAAVPAPAPPPAGGTQRPARVTPARLAETPQPASQSHAHIPEPEAGLTPGSAKDTGTRRTRAVAAKPDHAVRLPLWALTLLIVLLLGSAIYLLQTAITTQQYVGAYILFALVGAVVTFGALGSTGVVKTKGYQLGGAAAIFVVVLGILLPFAADAIQDISGALYVDGSPPQAATVYLLEVETPDNKRELTQANQGQFFFKGVRGGKSELVFNVVVSGFHSKVVRTTHNPGSFVKLELSTRELNPMSPSEEKAPEEKIVLIEVNITFQSHDDGKANDTKLAISVVRSGVLVASQADIAPNQEFVSGESAGPFSVPIVSAITKDDLKVAIAQCAVQPNGNDNWRFDATMSFKFSDGSVLAARTKPASLSAENRVATWSLANAN
jgi:hypothetical protein